MPAGKDFDKELRKGAMALFMGKAKAAEHFDNEALNEQNLRDWQREQMDTLVATGTLDNPVKPIISGNMSHILNLSSGLPRLQTHVIKRFSLIISQPLALTTFNPFEVRCCLCRSVIRYPAWYYSIKYAVNHFHYFICFDASSPDKPSTKCYRRS